MKKTLIVLLLISLSQLLPAKGDRFFASVGAAALMPADKEFKSLYGEVHVSPEIKAGYTLFRGFYFWAGASFFSATGVLPVLEDEVKVSQMFFSLGAGWEARLGRRLRGEIFAAALLAGFREKGMGDSVSRSAPGLEVGGGLRYMLKKKLFAGLGVSYAGASTTARTEAGETDIVLGGLRLSGRLGIRF